MASPIKEMSGFNNKDHNNRALELKTCTKRRSNERRPASLGTALQQHWPLVRMKLMSFLSSSAVHGPFFNPTLSQQGCLPIFSFWFYSTKLKCQQSLSGIELREVQINIGIAREKEREKERET